MSRHLRLHQLEAFVEVARLGSVTRAAASLSLTQPAVTRILRDLEQVCGVALVTKEGRGIRLTRQGEVFLRYAGQSLAAARGGLAAVADLALSDRPAIRIGALPTVSAFLMPAVVNRYLGEDMRTPLRISTGENRLLLGQLRDGDLDLVVGRMPTPETMLGLAFQPLYRDIVVFAVHRSHALAERKSLAASDLLPWPMLMPTPQSIIWPLVKQLFVEQGLREPQRTTETVSDSFGRAFTRRYAAIWIISRGVIADDLETGDFVALPIDTQSTLGAVGLCFKADHALPPAAEILVTLIKSEVAMRGGLEPIGGRVRAK